MSAIRISEYLPLTCTFSLTEAQIRSSAFRVQRSGFIRSEFSVERSTFGVPILANLHNLRHLWKSLSTLADVYPQLMQIIQTLGTAEP